MFMTNQIRLSSWETDAGRNAGRQGQGLIHNTSSLHDSRYRQQLCFASSLFIRRQNPKVLNPNACSLNAIAKLESGPFLWLWKLFVLR